MADDAYRRQYESVMADEGDQSANGDLPTATNDTNGGPSTYTERMLDVLGSDGEEEDVRGYRVEPKLPDTLDDDRTVTNGKHPQPSSSAPPLYDQPDVTIDDEVSQVKRYTNGDISSMTEDVSVSSSTFSLKPLRPWQFPAPRRLRMLRADDGSIGGSSPSQPATPSLLSNSDDGGRPPLPLLPYGAPHSLFDRADASANGHDTHRKPALPSRSFLRMSRLCILSDSEGSPTVMAVASGVVAVGTMQGKVALFDRSRGWTGAISVEGTISALAISSDKGFLAIGTSNGHIYLYDMTRLHTPARHVPPVTPLAVSSNRGEGHLQHSRILHLAFVGTRHTAVVSADDHGLSFYHSLGKILGVSSNDTLRILGRYPDAFADGERAARNKSTVLAMATLPLGPQQHQSDVHSFVALLTPSKLVLVGLKPAARTWYRRISPERDDADAPVCGCVAWLPCSMATKPSSATTGTGLVLPALAFSFGRHLYLVRLHTPGGGQEVVVREWQSWTHDAPIEALQWLTHETIVVYARQTLRLYDVRRQSCTEEQPFARPIAQRWIAEQIGGRETLGSLGGSVRSHKGQLFVLAATELMVGTLISWADRLLAHVSQGDSLGAIELATKYLRDPQSGGSRIGLPERAEEQRPLIAGRLAELMRASTAYAFSEERMKDDMAHYPQGVDRTPLFRGLARVCAEACLALDDVSFLFDELYDTYAEAGIEAVFADEMEDFIVQGRIRTLPIPVVQRLVVFRKRQERYDLAERIIRNVDPACLDLDQCISLCREQRLFDALIYVYTNALHDFVSPVVELMPLLQQQQEGGAESTAAYRIFSYLSVVLLGRTYPDQGVLEDAEARTARSTLYGFLFSGRCLIWPQGAGGELVLTHDSDVDDRTYPYLRRLLGYDAEALLDALDVAMEDAWLDEQQDAWSRQRIVSILFELNEDAALNDEARTFLAIFIARNAPKYPQFIHLAPAQVDSLIRTLSTVATETEETHSDRQYAVECLLSAYRPAQTEKLLALFERAGFTDILRRAYRSENRWDKLAEMTVSELSESVFVDLDDIIRRSKRSARVRAVVLQALPALVDVDAERAAALVQRRLADQLDEAIHVLERSPHRQLSFLAVLMHDSASAERLKPAMRSHYLALLCSMQPQQVVRALDTHGQHFFDLAYVAEVSREEDVLDALLWAQDRSGQAAQGFKDLAAALSERAYVLRNEEAEGDERDTSTAEESEEAHQASEQIRQVTDMAVRICTERARETLWVELLQILIQFTHDVQSTAAAITFARTTLQDALSSFVSSTSADDVSFARLFERLAPSGRESTYAEVRDIADAMMAAYKVRQELLGITNRLFGRDVFTAMQRLTRQRRRGWRPAAANVRCPGCGRACIGGGRGGRQQSGDGDRSNSGRRSLSVTVSQSDLTLGTGATTLSSPSLLRRRSSVMDIAVPMSRSPSFLDPGISPRPDKGKGVVRGDDSARMLASSDVEEERTSDLWGRDERAREPNDYFGGDAAAWTGASQGATMRATRASRSTSTSDPTETFMATPSLATTEEQMSMSYSIDNGKLDGTPLDSGAAQEDEDDYGSLGKGVVVCFSGQVWHRYCAPAHFQQQQRGVEGTPRTVSAS